MRPFPKLIVGLLLCIPTAAPALAEPAKPIAEILPQFEKISQQLFDESGVPGMSIGIVYKGEVVYLKGFGIRKAGFPEKVDPDTVFQLASCSKPLTSTALAALAGQGKLSWDDRIQKTLPEFALDDAWVSGNLTYRDMLSHHSGLPGEAGDVLEDLGYDRATILHNLRYLEPAYDFRAGYAYTNYGFTSAGEAAARAAGTTYETMMDEVLFKPLGMTSTSARFTDYVSSKERAWSHRIVGGKAIPTVRMPQEQAPAGGVSSTARDMTKWMELHLAEGKVDGKTFIPEEQLAQTYKIHSLASNNPATFSGNGYYGLGWGVAFDNQGELRLSHSGAFSTGIRTCVTMVPQQDVGIVVLANAFPSALPEALSVTFLSMYHGEPATISSARDVNKQVVAILSAMNKSDVVTEKPKASVPSLPLKTYAGTYHSDFLGDVVVSQKGPGLLIKVGTQEFALEHIDRDVFVAKPDIMMFEDLTAFNIGFVVDGKGQVSGFRQTGLGVEAPWFDKK